MKAEDLIGKTVFVAYYRSGEDGKFLGQRVCHGRIVSVGVETSWIRLRDEEANVDYFVPARLDALYPAPPGTYGDSDTGELWENPDFYTQWRVKMVPGDDRDYGGEWSPCGEVDFPPPGKPKG